jgi:hypothetical protein
VVGGAPPATLVAMLLDDRGEGVEYVRAEGGGVSAHLGHGGGSAPAGVSDPREPLVVRVRDADDVRTDRAASPRATSAATNAVCQEPAIARDEMSRVLERWDPAQLGDGAVV